MTPFYNEWSTGSLVKHRDVVYVVWADINRSGILHLSYPETPGMPVKWSIPWQYCTPV